MTWEGGGLPESDIILKGGLEIVTQDDMGEGGQKSPKNE